MDRNEIVKKLKSGIKTSKSGDDVAELVTSDVSAQIVDQLRTYPMDWDALIFLVRSIELAAHEIDELPLYYHHKRLLLMSRVGDPKKLQKLGCRFVAHVLDRLNLPVDAHGLAECAISAKRLWLQGELDDHELLDIHERTVWPLVQNEHSTYPAHFAVAAARDASGISEAAAPTAIRASSAVGASHRVDGGEWLDGSESESKWQFNEIGRAFTDS